VNSKEQAIWTAAGEDEGGAISSGPASIRPAYGNPFFLATL